MAIKRILGKKSKNLCDVAHLLTLPLDKTLERQGYLRVLINAEPNTTYTFSRENANQINIGTTYLVITAYDDIAHNNWLNHEDVPSLCNKSATLTTNSDGKLWIMFSGDVYYNYWQKNLNPFGYIQLELGSAATEYVPYELTSYKSIMKVNDNFFITSFDERMPCKTKNLFDIDKFIDTPYMRRNGNSLICSVYGTSIGTLGTYCPSLKIGDTATVSFKCTSQGVASGFVQIGGKVLVSGENFTISETTLTSPFYLYNTDWANRDTPNKTTYSDIQLVKGLTATDYVPYNYV